MSEATGSAAKKPEKRRLFDYHPGLSMSDHRSKPRAASARASQAPAAAAAPEGEGLGFVLEFMRLVWGVDHALQSRSKRMDQVLGVTGPQRLVVRVVGRYPQASAGDIARTLRVHPSTLTGILRRLESRGFVRRVNDAQDKRRALFTLTKSGSELDTVKAGTVEAAVRRALRRLPEGHLEAAAEVLNVLTEELERDDA
jgi:DNA-binding MarR family transcriptional regulator